MEILFGYDKSSGLSGARETGTSSTENGDTLITEASNICYCCTYAEGFFAKKRWCQKNQKNDAT